MNRRILLLWSGCLVAAVTLFSAAPMARAGTPLGGLTVALSPDESILVASGDPRTLYVIDAASLEVTGRVWVETTVVGLAFNGDGSVLAVHDSKDEVRLYSTADWSLVTTLKGAYGFSTSRAGDSVAGYTVSDHTLRIWSLTDGSEKLAIELPERTNVSALGLNSEGTKLAVLLKEEKDESEKEVAYADIPKELKGLEKERFKMENDGKTSKFSIYDTSSGAAMTEQTLFYSSTSVTQIGFAGDSAVVINYRNQGAFIAPDGTVEMFEMPSSFNYGMGFSPDQTLVMGGGLAHGSWMNTADKTFVEYRTDKLPGWPEYFKGFCAAGDGTVYGTTTGYRLIKVAPDGTVVEQKPIH